jgi:hypothetical protein
MNDTPVHLLTMRGLIKYPSLLHAIRAIEEARMPEKPQHVVFVENYMDPETRISYYRGDNVVVTEQEYRNATSAGAVRDGEEHEYSEAMQVEGGMRVPVAGATYEQGEPVEQQGAVPNSDEGQPQQGAAPNTNEGQPQQGTAPASNEGEPQQG